MNFRSVEINSRVSSVPVAETLVVVELEVLYCFPQLPRIVPAVVDGGVASIPGPGRGRHLLRLDEVAHADLDR